MKAIINQSKGARMGYVGVGATEAEARADTSHTTWSGKPMRGGDCVDMSRDLADAVAFVRAEDARNAGAGEHVWHPDCRVIRRALSYVTLRDDGVLDFDGNAIEDARAYFAQCDADDADEQ